jgi:hypothetical protein
VDHRCKCREGGLRRDHGTRSECSKCGWLKDGRSGLLEVPPVSAERTLVKIYRLAKDHTKDPDTLLEEIADLAEPFVPEPRAKR